MNMKNKITNLLLIALLGSVVISVVPKTVNANSTELYLRRALELETQQRNVKETVHHEQTLEKNRVKMTGSKNINVNRRRTSPPPQIIAPKEVYIEETIVQPSPIIIEKIIAPSPNTIQPIITTQDTLQQTDSYSLGAEDKIKITVFGEKDISGDFKIADDGSISMPLIGVVSIKGKTLREAEDHIENKLRNGYLKEPDVTIEVLASRPFYIMGEVRRPGSYNYISGMNLLQAVAISGGFTYRANKKKIEVLRGTPNPNQPLEMLPEDIVRAGDIIFVRERFF